MRRPVSVVYNLVFIVFLFIFQNFSKNTKKLKNFQKKKSLKKNRPPITDKREATVDTETGRRMLF